ncbi:MAG: hypothetical protein JWL85_58 [Candidatus Saccharibacteria bacterium]|nr:hypothetical protein [Candidatus Saccharibacteria bacterium]
MANKDEEGTEVHIPDEGAVDDRDTMEGQLVTGKVQEHHLPKMIDVQIRKYLSGLTYPLTTEELHNLVYDQGANSGLLQIIDALPDRSYGSYTDVWNAVEGK